MPTTTHIDNLKINLLTKAQFQSAEKDSNQLYFITDEDENQTAAIADTHNYFTSDTVEGALDELGAAKLNPTSKTSAMTQEVGKDSNGKLWTSPGGGEEKGKITIGGTAYTVTRKALTITNNGTTTTYYVADIT